MLCALLAGGLTLGSTALHAQEAQTVTVEQTPTDVDGLTDGFYVINAASEQNSMAGLLYYDPAANQGKFYRMDADKQAFAEGEEVALNYVWKYEFDEDTQTFTLRNARYGTYMIADPNKNQNMTGSVTANLKLASDGSATHVTMTNYQHRSGENNDGEPEATYWYINRPTNEDPTLSWWMGIDNSLTVQFYKVDGLTDVTYKYKVTNVGITFEQTATQLVGNAYEAPDVNFYTVTQPPKGEVTGRETEPVEVECTASYPGGLVAKPMTADGEFATDAKWYTLSVRSGRAVVATADGIRTQGQTRQLAKGNMWTFVKEDGNPDGFKVYNLLKGAASPLYMANNGGNNVGNTVAAFGTGSEETGTSTFLITTNGDGFNLQYPGTPNANLGDHGSGGVLAVWNHSTSATDVGSCFVVAEVNDLLELALNTDKYLGGIDATAAANLMPQYKNFVAGVNTTEALTALCEFDYTNAQKLELTDGYYRIKCAPVRGDRNLSLDATNNRLSCATPSEADASQIWKIAATGDGLYTLTAQGVAPVKVAGGNTPVSYTEAGGATATTFYVNKGNVNDSRGTEGLMWFFDTTTGDINNDQHTALNFNGGNVILMPNNYGASVWYIQKAETIGLTIGGALCGTFCYDFAVELPEGLTAYCAVNDDADAIYLESIEERVVPANTPVLVRAEAAKTYELTILSDDAPLGEKNAFEGTLLPKAIDGGVNAYILGMKDTDVAPRFYLVSEDDRMMPANKAYYVATGTQTQGFRLSFDGTTTGIDSTVTIEGGETEVYYDLSGRRVLYPAKGIYVKANGQKVYLK